MYYNDNKVIIAELARKYGTSYDVVKEAVESPFAFMYKLLHDIDLEKESLPEFHIPRLGKFKVRYKFREDEDIKL